MDSITVLGRTWTREEWITTRAQTYVEIGFPRMRAFIRACRDWTDLEDGTWGGYDVGRVQ